MFERFDPPLIPNPGPDDLAAAKARWATHRRRIVMAASGTSVVVVSLLAALLAPTFGLGNHDQHVASTGPATTTTQLTPPTTEGPITSTTARRPSVSVTAAPPLTRRLATVVETYSPWTAAGTLAPGVQVRDHLSGTSCDMPSVFDGSQNAWRCSLPNGGFYDPCFAPPSQTNVTTVACANDPWSAVDLMSLSQPLAKGSSGAANPNLAAPWAMLLANAERCAVIHGTGTQIGPTMFNYGCTHGYAAEPDRKSEPWTTSYSPDPAGPVSSVAVMTTWA